MGRFSIDYPPFLIKMIRYMKKDELTALRACASDFTIGPIEDRLFMMLYKKREWVVNYWLVQMDTTLRSLHRQAFPSYY